jgi:hypothetical protein
MRMLPLSAVAAVKLSHTCTRPCHIFSCRLSLLSVKCDIYCQLKCDRHVALQCTA